MLLIAALLLLVILVSRALSDRIRRRREAFARALEPLFAEEAAFWRVRQQMDHTTDSERVATLRESQERHLVTSRGLLSEIEREYPRECRRYLIHSGAADDEIAAMLDAMRLAELGDVEHRWAREHAMRTSRFRERLGELPQPGSAIALRAVIGALLGGLLGFGSFFFVALAEPGDQKSALLLLWHSVGVGALSGAAIVALILPPVLRMLQDR